MILHKGKKLVFGILLVLSVLAFTGCSDNAEPDDTPVTLPAPQNISVTESATVNCVTVTWNAIDCDEDHYYWIYWSKTNDTSSLETPNYYLYKSSSIKNGVGSYDVNLSESGTYYFWVKAASGYPGSKTTSSDFSEASEPFEFTLKVLDAPTGVKATVSSNKVNAVTVTWNAIDCDEEHYYWIYWSKTNDTSSLKTPNYGYYRSSYIKNGVGSYDVSLSESGTYYFWVRAASSTNSYFSSTVSSDFSSVASVDFTHEQLTAPVGLKVSAFNSSSYPLKLEWTSAKAPYYHVYMNTENNSETAGLVSAYNTSNYALISASKLTAGTTYYFWVKSADTSSIDSPTSDFSEVCSYDWTGQ